MRKPRSGAFHSKPIELKKGDFRKIKSKISGQKPVKTLPRELLTTE
jgi:hypothetical protein